MGIETETITQEGGVDFRVAPVVRGGPATILSEGLSWQRSNSGLDSAMFREVGNWIENRYSRRTMLEPRRDNKGTVIKRGRGPRRVPVDTESVKRSLWLKDVAQCLFDTELMRLERAEEGIREHVDPLAQWNHELRMLSEPFKIHSREELRLIKRMWESLLTFRPGWGYLESPIGVGEDRIKSHAEAFVEEAEAWEKEGMNAAVWVDALRGLVTVDPLFREGFFSSQNLFGRIYPLSGVMLNRYSSVLSKDNISEEEEKTFPDPVRLQRDIFQRLGRVPSRTFDQLRHFAGQVRSLIDAKLQVGYYKGSGNAVMEEVRESSRRLSTLLELMKIGGYAETDLARPTSFSRLLTPVAAALTEEFTDRIVDEERLKGDIPERLVSAVRGRRIKVDELPDFCAAFRTDPDVDYTKITLRDITENPNLREDGLARVAVLLGDHPDKLEILQAIFEKVIPNFIFHLRIRGIETPELKWSQEVYRGLGLGEELWHEHSRKIQEVISAKPLQREDIKPGSVFIEWSSQADPFHHDWVTDILGTSPAELMAAGIITSEESPAELVLAVKVNWGNPKKQPEVDVKTRHSLVVTALRHIRDRVYLYEVEDVSSATPERIARHQEWFEDNGISLTSFVRYAGADGLEYPEYQEGSSMFGIPHIIALQRDQLGDIPTILEEAGRIFLMFENSREDGKAGIIIAIHQKADIHSSDIREGIAKSDIPRDALYTIIPPIIMQETLKMLTERPPEKN